MKNYIYRYVNTSCKETAILITNATIVIYIKKRCSLHLNHLPCHQNKKNNNCHNFSYYPPHLEIDFLNKIQQKLMKKRKLNKINH